MRSAFRNKLLKSCQVIKANSAFTVILEFATDLKGSVTITVDMENNAVLTKDLSKIYSSNCAENGEMK